MKPTSSDNAFYAHSTQNPDRADWQPLSLHLTTVAKQAREFAEAFGAGNLGEVAGLLHDLGKYTQEYLRRISGDGPRVDHSSWGAIVARERYASTGFLLAYGIAGHHAGLANGTKPGERSALKDRLRPEGLPTLDEKWKEEIALPPSLALPATLKVHSRERSAFQLAFLTRMVFSCLVDADFIDTERFYLAVEGKRDHRSLGSTPSLSDLQAHLRQHLSGFEADTPVNRIRADILQTVVKGAAMAPGLFSLTVPTGGGKTLASLAFALDHAIAHGLRRVIFVAPFTSIVEQNAAVFRKALGDLGARAVLEHHSNFVESPAPPDNPEHYQARQKLKLAMENWDSPIVVTTAVQFFESLFAARPSQCRKLHNIAGSVVILDEAQALPLKLLLPSVAAIDELARNYRVSVVLCTATQPALEAPAFLGGLTAVRELAPNPPQLFRQLERVRVRHAGLLSDADISQHMRDAEQVLCIVNNRRHARAVFEAMADLPGALHLSTLMCARHRSAVLDEVRRRLKAKESCRLVSTSLIEAGVDVDFPKVLRAEAGLDSIAQAAGRCNREGRRDATTSEVLVFATDNDDWAPPPELKQYAQVAREVLRQHAGDPLAPLAIRRYFELLYWQRGPDQLDVPALMGLLRDSRADSLPMETLAAKYRLIDSAQMPVIVPYDDTARDALRDLEFAEGSVGLARKLQPYLVQLPRQGYDALYKAGVVRAVAPHKWGEQFVQLINPDIYSRQFGLHWDDPTFMEIVSTIY